MKACVDLIWVLLLAGTALQGLGQEISGIGVALAKDGGDFVVKGVIPGGQPPHCPYWCL